MARVTAKVIEKNALWKKLLAKVGRLGAESRVKVGVLASKGGTKTHPDSPNITMIELAAIHEFGSPAAGIPERSFLRSTFKDKKPEMRQICERIAKAILEDRLDAQSGLALLGQWGAAAVKKQITEGDGIPPPNKPETIRRKGSTRTLVDSGQLVGSISYEVVGEDGEPVADAGPSEEGEGEE